MMRSISIVLALFALGCPESSPEDTPVVATQDVGGMDATRPDMGGGVDAETPEGAYRVTLTPIDWGLFPTSDVGETVTATSSGAPVTVEVGPGVWSVEVTDDDNVVFTSDADPVAPDGALRARIFNPDTSQLTFEFGSEPSVSSDRAAQPVDLDAASGTGFGAWFDEAMNALEGAADPGGATVALVSEQRERGGPRKTSAGTLFMVAAQDGEQAPQIRGTWNNFEADAASELRRVRQGLWARYIDVPAGRQEYKVYYPSGDAWVTDLSNPNIAWDGFDPGTVGDFNSVLEPSGARMVWLPAVESPELGNTRDVYVHLPSTYGQNPLPALYLHDGNESIVRGRFHIAADELAGTAPGTAAVLAFIALPSQDVRMSEYTMATADSRGDDYVDFLANTLVPRIEANFDVRPERSARGLGGASLGGLISFWGAMKHPGTFGYAAGMSSSFFWEDGVAMTELESLGCQDVRYYLDSGSPNDNHDVTIEMRDLLDGLGCANYYVVEPGGQHDWSYWYGRFGGVLEQFAVTHGGG